MTLDYERDGTAYEMPWGADVTVLPCEDDLDRVVLPWTELPEQWQATNRDVVITRPRLDPSVDTAFVHAVFSWMNDRVMYALVDVGDGIAMSWWTCGRCAQTMQQCRCGDGITLSSAIRWAFKRHRQGWGDSRQADAAESVGVEVDRTAAEPAEKPVKRRKKVNGTPVTPTGAATVLKPDEVPDLAEIDGQAANVADELLSRAMGER